MGTPNGEVHAVYNQAEYPPRPRRYRASIQREAERTNFGFPLMGPNRFYHKDNFGWPGTFIPWSIYPLTAVLDQEMYSGEAFMRMQTMQALPHPSGLPDDAPLMGERLAEVMRGGV